LLTAVLALAFLASPRWLPLIRDGEMPTLAAELQAGQWLLLAAALFGLALLAALLARGQGPGRLLALQLPIAVFVPLVLLPIWSLGDQLRGLPVRQMAALVNRQARPGEPLAMVGILKPSLHYYSRRVVIYEAPTPGGSINLVDRLSHEQRRGLLPSSSALQPTVLVVIDQETAARPYWAGLALQELGRSSIYRLWRVDRQALERRAADLLRSGERISWRDPRPERY
jgi:hypothetical protein